MLCLITALTWRHEDEIYCSPCNVYLWKIRNQLFSFTSPLRSFPHIPIHLFTFDPGAMWFKSSEVHINGCTDVFNNSAENYGGEVG